MISRLAPPSARNVAAFLDQITSALSAIDRGLTALRGRVSAVEARPVIHVVYDAPPVDEFGNEGDYALVATPSGISVTGPKTGGKWPAPSPTMKVSQ